MTMYFFFITITISININSIDSLNGSSERWGSHYPLLWWGIWYVFLRKAICPFFRVSRGPGNISELLNGNGQIDEVTRVTSEVVRSLAQERKKRGWSVSSWLSSDFSIYEFIQEYRVGFFSYPGTCWAKSSSWKTYFLWFRENHRVWWNHVLLLKSVVNPISDRSSSFLKIVPFFSYPYECEKQGV